MSKRPKPRISIAHGRREWWLYTARERMAPGLGGWTRTGPHCILRPVNPGARSVNERRPEERRGREGERNGGSRR